MLNDLLKGAPIEDFIKTSVKQTVQHNYNENNTAAMMTFDKIQEGVGFNVKIIFIDFHSFTLLSWSAAAVTGRRAGSSPPSTIITSRARSLGWPPTPSITPSLGPAAGKGQHNHQSEWGRIIQQLNVSYDLLENIIKSACFIIYCKQGHSLKAIYFPLYLDARRQQTAPTTSSWRPSRSRARRCCSGMAACRSWTGWWGTASSTSSGGSGRWRSWVRRTLRRNWVMIIFFFISRNIRHDVFTLPLLRGQKNRRLESLIISLLWIM